MIDHKVRSDFNAALDKCINPRSSIEDFCTAIATAGKEVLFDDDEAEPSWFELNKDFLRPLLSHRNELLFQSRNSKDDDAVLKRKCIDARRNVRDAVLLAKNRWVREVASRVHKINFYPK